MESYVCISFKLIITCLYDSNFVSSGDDMAEEIITGQGNIAIIYQLRVLIQCAGVGKLDSLSGIKWRYLI